MLAHRRAPRDALGVSSRIGVGLGVRRRADLPRIAKKAIVEASVLGARERRDREHRRRLDREMRVHHDALPFPCVEQAGAQAVSQPPAPVGRCR